MSEKEAERKVSIVLCNTGLAYPEQAHFDCPACHSSKTKVKKHKTWNERYCPACGFRRAEKK